MNQWYYGYQTVNKARPYIDELVDLIFQLIIQKNSWNFIFN